MWETLIPLGRMAHPDELKASSCFRVTCLELHHGRRARRRRRLPRRPDRPRPAI